VLSNCYAIRPDGPPFRTKTYIGVVRVERPALSGWPRVSEVKALGAGWDGGPWLGWRSDSLIEADPSKCQLIVVIRAPVEAANAAEVLRSLKGMQPCVVDYTR
jgi:hypothetical protein